MFSGTGNPPGNITRAGRRVLPARVRVWVSFSTRVHIRVTQQVKYHLVGAGMGVVPISMYPWPSFGELWQKFVLFKPFNDQ